MKQVLECKNDKCIYRWVKKEWMNAKSIRTMYFVFTPILSFKVISLQFYNDHYYWMMGPILMFLKFIDNELL